MLYLHPRALVEQLLDSFDALQGVDQFAFGLTINVIQSLPHLYTLEDIDHVFVQSQTAFDEAGQRLWLLVDLLLEDRPNDFINSVWLIQS